MSDFDWLTFLDRHNIDYRTQGANVGGDHVAVRCPFCGARDPSQHMSISTTGAGWHCWRDSSHAGVSPTRLVKALLHCDWTEAAEITGRRTVHERPRGKTLSETVAGLLHPMPVMQPPGLELPVTCRPLSLKLPVSEPYRDYVRQRGFDPNQLDPYDVFFDHRGRFHGRIVFAIKAAGGSRIVGFTGRGVSQRVEPRYLFEGKTDTTLLWSYMFPETARTLVLCEGPFDALKVNTLGNRSGIYATCCMTAFFSRTQQSLLYNLIPRFGQTIALFDHGNEVAGYRLANLFPGRIRPCRLPDTVEDPAELTSLEFLPAL